MSEANVKILLQRIRGWKAQMKELSQESSEIQKRINESEKELDTMLDE